MTGSSRPRLRSEISRGHSHDDLSESTSARTRPFSYDEIMRRRKSKKQANVFKEEGRETDDATNEEIVKNFDQHGKDANAAAVKFSSNHALDADSREKEDTHNRSKNKESRDSRSKHDYEKDLTHGMEAVKTNRRGHVSGKLDEVNRDVDLRSKQKHDKHEKNGTEVSKSNRGGNISGEIHEENHDLNALSRGKHDNSVKNRDPLLKADRHGNVRDKMDEESQDMDSRYKHEQKKYVKNDTHESITERRGYGSGRREEDRDMNPLSKDKHDHNVRNRSSLLNADRRGNVRDKMDVENHYMDSRSKYEQRKYVKNDPKVLITDRRGYQIGRRDEDSYDMNAGSKDNHEKIVKISTPLLKSDRRGNVRGKMDEKDQDVFTRSNYEHKKYVKNDTQVSIADRRGYKSGRRDEESYDMNGRFKDNAEKIVKSNTPSLRDDRQENLRDKHDEEGHDVDSRSKNKHEKDMRNSAEGLKTIPQSHVRSKQGEVSRVDAKYENDDKHHRDYVPQSRYTERNREVSESEKKRKDRTVDDEKYRPRDSLKKLDSGHRADDEKYRPRDSLKKHESGRRVDDEKYRPRDSLNKHDSGHRVGSDVSERKEKMDLTHFSHAESRSKRRRSRSQDRSKDKNRRSRSASPKVRKNTLSREQDHGPLSLQSQKDDVDRSNVASNGTISHHRQHSGFSSGLGGYSPRKRKTEAAIKTPSPIRSPERKGAGRDLPLSGVDNLNTSGSQPVSHIMSTNKIGLAIGTSVVPSLGFPLSTTLFHGFSTFKEASVDSVQLTQATRPMRRLYIDNIPASASEKEIMESFNTYLLSSGSNHIRGTRPCLSCMINKEKGQALLEFLTPEDASAALSFDGRSLYGSVLKIRRPKDYVEITSGSVEILKAKAVKDNALNDVAARDVGKDVAISDTVKDSPHKIFVGGIADGLSSEMIMEIFSVLGSLKAFRFCINKNLNEPCVFLEYADQSATLKACAALNGMKLDGRILTVTQAIPDTSSKVNVGSRPFYGIPEHVKPLLEEPTLVLKLSNVVDQKAMELISETDLEEIIDDVRLECSRFGSVVSINAVKTSNIHTTNSNVKEVINDEMPIQTRDESESCESRDHLNMDLSQAAAPATEVEDYNTVTVTNVEELKIVDNIKEGKLELAAPATEVEDSKMSSFDVEEGDTSAVNDEATNGPQQSVENSENMNESGSGVASLARPVDGTVIVKLGETETSVPADVDQQDKTTGKLQETASISDNSAANSRVIETPDVRNIFEVGCILVEFKRTEASSMAAHCLHGRLFDDRTVTAEYVSLEAYQARFPK